MHTKGNRLDLYAKFQNTSIFNRSHIDTSLMRAQLEMSKAHLFVNETCHVVDCRHCACHVLAARICSHMNTIQAPVLVSSRARLGAVYRTQASTALSMIVMAWTALQESTNVCTSTKTSGICLRVPLDDSFIKSIGSYGSSDVLISTHARI